MRAAAALAALLVLVPSTAAAAAARAIVLTTLFGEYHLVFDDARITEAEVRDLVVLSPHLAGWTSLAVAPRLERCVAGDPAYLDCARSTEPSRFLWNARVNLDAGEPCGPEANMAKYLASEAAWEAANACIDCHGGYGYAEEYDVERKFRECRLYKTAPVNNNLVLAYVGEHVLGMPRSY